MRRDLAWITAALVLATACKGGHEPPADYEDASRVRRVLRPPPPGEVRPVPPHAIHSRGVGPYVLGMPLRSILDSIPQGPNVVLAQIDGVVDYSLVRAEGGGLLIGVGHATGVAFVAVLDDQIARTESGVGVGTPVDQLRAALGEPLASPGVVMDPRLIGFESVPSARFALDASHGRVVAVVVRHRSPPAAPAEDRATANGETANGATANGATAEPPRPAPCRAREILGPHRDALVQAARLGPGSEAPEVRFGCFGAIEPEALVIAGDHLTVIAGEPDKLRRVAAVDMSGLVFAAPMDADGDGREEIAAVATTTGPEERVWRVEIVRIEAGRLVRMAAEDVYRVSMNSAAWVGANLGDIELLIELQAAVDGVRASGLFMQQSAEGPSTVAPLQPATIPLKRRRPAAVPPATEPAAGTSRDAGILDRDAGAPAPGTNEPHQPG